MGSHDIAVRPLKLALFEVPAQLRTSEGPQLMLAASTPDPGWLRQRVEISHAGRSFATRTARRKSVLGTLIGFASPNDASIEVALYDADQWLMSCSDEDLEMGDNVAMLGAELIQFGRAISIGPGRFRLTRLVRGQAGTDAAGHFAGEPFVLVDRAALEAVILPVCVQHELVRASAFDGTAECSLILSAVDPSP